MVCFSLGQEAFIEKLAKKNWLLFGLIDADERNVVSNKSFLSD